MNLTSKLLKEFPTGDKEEGSKTISLNLETPVL
jgi:hypothetical protein